MAGGDVRVVGSNRRADDDVGVVGLSRRAVKHKRGANVAPCCLDCNIGCEYTQQGDCLKHAAIDEAHIKDSIALIELQETTSDLAQPS
jgi:hypothetical protein